MMNLFISSLSLAKTEFIIEDLFFANSSFQSIEGLNLHYRLWQPVSNFSQGNVLLIHGFGSSTFSWRYVVPELVKNDYLVLAVDLPGFGLSQRKPSVEQSYEQRAKLIWKLLENLEILNVPWNLVGHSMGGGVVIAMALQKPEDTLTLTLVDGVFKSQNRKISTLLFQCRVLRNFTARILDKFFITKRRIRSFLNSAYGREPTPEEVEGYYQPLKLPHTYLTIAKLLRTYRSDLDLKRRISEITSPSLLVWGKEDKWVPIKEAEELIPKMSRAQLIIIEEAAHCPMETHPEVFNQYLLNFLKEFN